MPDVFISYKKEDQLRVEPIARALARAGYDVWWDHRIPPGRTYRDVIGAALQQAKCVIVVWSKLSATAQWVLDEADEGKRRNVLLPILIDDVEIPYGFRQIEAARLVGWNGEDAHPEWAGALDAVATLVGRAPGGPPKPFATPSAPIAPAAPSERSERSAPAPERTAPASRSRGAAVPLIALAAVVVVAGGGFAAWRAGVFEGAETTRATAASVEDGDAGEAGASDAATTSGAIDAAGASAGAGTTAPTDSRQGGEAAPPPPQPQPVRTVRVNVRDTSAFRVLSDGAWVEVGPTGVPRYRFTPQGGDGVGLVLLDETRGMRLRVNEDGSGIDGFDQGRWVRFLNAAGVERGPPPQARRGGQPSQGVTRVWFASGGMLAREDGGTWIETDPQTGMFNNYRWREESRDGDTILLSDEGRGAGARIELGEGWVYLSFPDWGEFRRHWRIRAVDREP